MNRNIEIIIPLFLYLLTINGLLAILKNPTTGYEISIYESSINELRILIISSLGAISYVYFIENKRKFLILITLILIITNNFIFLTLPALRGYIVQGDGDFLTHLGYMKDIISNGNLNNIVYPVSYIIITSVSLLANISLIHTAEYISPFFSIIYILFIFLISKKISDEDNRNQSIFILLSSTVFLFLGFEAELKPQYLSLLVIPMFLYFLFSRSSFGTRLTLILLVILVQFFHPLTSIYFLVSICLMIFYILITREKYVEKYVASYNDYKKLFTIGTMSFILWIYNFHQIWNSEINRLYNFIKGDVAPPINNVQSSFAKLKLTRLEIVEVFIRMYGHILIFVIITLIFIIYYLRTKEKKDSFNILIALFISGMIVAMLVAGGGIGLQIFRGLNFVTVLTPIFVGSFIYRFKKIYYSRKISRKIFVSIIILSIISFTWLIGVFGIFASPYVKMPTNQVTKTDVEGAEWFFKYKNPEVSFIGGHIYVRFAHLILGVNATVIRKDQPSKWEYMLPDHFNYTEFNRMGMSFSEDTYMPISIYDKVLYTTGPWKPVARFTNQDFYNISYDFSVNNLYDNGAMNIYYISSLNKSSTNKNKHFKNK